MSRGILKNFWDKEVRTEARTEQQEKQPWPTVTICSEAALMRYFTCHKRATFSPLTQSHICSKTNLNNTVRGDFSTKEEFSMKQGCNVYNSKGTLIHEGSKRRGLNIYYQDFNAGLSTEDIKIDVFFHDPKIAKNSSRAVFLQDLDVEGGSLPPGEYEFMLETKKIEKLGPPYRSDCTKRKSIGDKHHSIYSYAACMDKCMADIVFSKCRDVPEAFQDYIPRNQIKENGNESLECFGKLLNEYMIDPRFLSSCKCQQPCSQVLYPVTRNLIRNYSEKKWTLKIRFKSKMVNIIEEHPLHNTEELISQVGGSCGLFLGMSLLSLVEIIFHAVISFVKYCV